jgi:gephyrin
MVLKAVAPLLHKHAPGLVHGMLAASLNITPCKFST